MSTNNQSNIQVPQGTITPGHLLIRNTQQPPQNRNVARIRRERINGYTPTARTLFRNPSCRRALFQD